MGGHKVKRHFVIAHSLEAKPVIKHYGLVKNSSHRAFEVFENDQIKLIISGQGKVNCAAATAYCYYLSDSLDEQVLWVNLGVAGHPHYPIGSLWRVNKTIDSSTSKAIFPVNVIRTVSISAAPAITVDKAERDYAQDSLYDMEVSGFFQAASRFTSLEYASSFKIVSDNKDQTVDNFDSAAVPTMIEAQLATIDDYLLELENNIINNFKFNFQDIEFKELILNSYQFTQSQRIQCETLLNSLAVHQINLDKTALHHTSAKQLLDSLSDRLSQIKLTV